MCFPNRSSGVYPLKQGHMKQLPLSINKWFYPPTATPPPPPPHTPPASLPPYFV